MASAPPLFPLHIFTQIAKDICDVAMSQTYMKQVNQVWYQIYQIVKENCAVEYGGRNPQDDFMERLLTARKGN